MKNKKNLLRIIIGLIAVVVIVLAVAKKKGFIGDKPGIRVTVEKAEKRTIIEIVAASGKIQPEVEVKLSPDLSGEVVELNVKEGDFVLQGQILAKIKPEIYISN